MSRYLRMIPVMLYPYAYLIPLLILFLVPAEGDNMGRVYVFVFNYGLLIHLAVFTLAIHNAIMTAKDPAYSVRTGADINLLIKGVQIPAYIFHFVLACLGTFMSIWGIGVILFAIVVDFLSILTSGISAIGVHIRMAKQGYVSKGVAVLLAVGSFLYCVDVGIAIFDEVYLRVRGVVAIPEAAMKEKPLPKKKFERKALIALGIVFLGALLFALILSFGEVNYPKAASIFIYPWPYEIGLYLSFALLLGGYVLCFLLKNRGNSWGYELLIEAAIAASGLFVLLNQPLSVNGNNPFVICFGESLFEIGGLLFLASLIGLLRKGKNAPIPNDDHQ